MRFGRMCTSGRGEMSELAEGARLEIVYTSKAYLGFESPSLRQNNERAHARYAYGADAPHPMRRGGRVVECGGLENRFTRNPGDEGSNPSSSASLNQTPGTPGVFHFPPPVILSERSEPKDPHGPQALDALRAVRVGEPPRSFDSGLRPPLRMTAPAFLMLHLSQL